MSNFLNDLITTRRPEDAAAGSGVLARAANVSKLQQLYQQYAIKTQSEGQEPVPIEQFAREYGLI